MCPASCVAKVATQPAAAFGQNTRPMSSLTPHQSQYIAWQLAHCLLVRCFFFRGITGAAATCWSNLTQKKVSRRALARCGWGEDDYSLNAANLRLAVPPSPPVPLLQAGVERRARKPAPVSDLFGDGGEER